MIGKVKKLRREKKTTVYGSSDSEEKKSDIEEKKGKKDKICWEWQWCHPNQWTQTQTNHLLQWLRKWHDIDTDTGMNVIVEYNVMNE